MNDKLLHVGAEVFPVNIIIRAQKCCTTFVVSGNPTFDGSVDIEELSKLSVRGRATFNGNVTTRSSGYMAIFGAANFTSPQSSVYVNDFAEIGEDAVFNGGLILGPKGELFIGGSAIFNGNIDFSSDDDSQSTLRISGDATFTNLQSEDDISGNGNLLVAGTTSFGSK